MSAREAPVDEPVTRSEASSMAAAERTASARGPGGAAVASELLHAVAIGVAAGLLLALLLPTRADTDLWGHVRFGLDLLAGGSPDRPDPYSYLTTGIRWINHETLSELALAAGYTLGGGAGIAALKAAVTLTIGALLVWRLRALGLSGWRTLAVLAPATILLMPRLATARPQIFSTLFFAVTLVVLVRAEAGARRGLWWLVPIAALWVNTHGGVLVGVGLAVLWAAIRQAAERRLDLGITLSVAAAALALVLNPYGPALPDFLVRTATVPRPDVAEWAPLRIASSQGIAYLLLLAMILSGLRRDGLRHGPARYALLSAVALLPLNAQRHTDLFAVGMVLLGGEALAAALRPAASRGNTRATPLPRAVTGGLAILAAATILVAAMPDPGCIRLDAARSKYPARAVAMLAASGIRANVVVPVAWGEYVIWHAGPRLRVSVDGRRETVYPAGVRERAFRVMTGEGDWAELLRDRRTDLALTVVGSPGDNLLRAYPGWSIAYEDDTAAVFARSASPLLERLRRTPAPDLPTDGAGLCVGPPWGTH